LSLGKQITIVNVIPNLFRDLFNVNEMLKQVQHDD
jgi:hypothetical protein